MSAGKPAATSCEYSDKGWRKLKFSPDWKITLAQGSPPTSGCPGCYWDSLLLQVRPQMNSYFGVPTGPLCMEKSMCPKLAGRFFGQSPKNMKESNIGFLFFLVKKKYDSSKEPWFLSSQVLFWSNHFIYCLFSFVWWISEAGFRVWQCNMKN